MKRKLLFWLLFCGSLLLFGFQTIEAFGIVAFHAEFFEKKPTIVIDAGHGGEDGGAVGINGLVEKDVNLSIALSLAEDLKANHFTVILVREGDYSVAVSYTHLLGEHSAAHHHFYVGDFLTQQLDGFPHVHHGGGHQGT